MQRDLPFVTNISRFHCQRPSKYRFSADLEKTSRTFCEAGLIAWRESLTSLHSRDGRLDKYAQLTSRLDSKNGSNHYMKPPFIFAYASNYRVHIRKDAALYWVAATISGRQVVGDGISEHEHFSGEGFGDIKESWVTSPVRAGGGLVPGIDVHLKWQPVSPMLATVFDRLFGRFLFTQSLSERISSVRFSIDEYVLFDWKFDAPSITNTKPRWWPDELTNEEACEEWRGVTLGNLQLDHMPPQQNRT